MTSSSTTSGFCTIRNVFTRMVAVVNGELARRRVFETELVFGDVHEDVRVRDVLQRFGDARLIARGAERPDDRFLRGQQPLRLALHQQLRGSLRHRRAEARAGRRRRDQLRRAAARWPGLDPSAGGTRTDGRRRDERPARAERAVAAGAIGSEPSSPSRCQIASAPRATHRSASFEDIVAGRRWRAVQVRTSAASNSGEDHSSRLRFVGVEAAASASRRCCRRTRRTFDGVMAEMDALREAVSAGAKYQLPSTTSSSSASRSSKC